MRTAAALCALLLSSPAAAACRLEDVDVKQGRIVNNPTGSVRVVGELISTCAEPTGVLLRLTFRDKAGGVVGMQEAWGAAQRIEARGTLPFDVFSIPVARPESVDSLIAVVPIP